LKQVEQTIDSAAFTMASSGTASGKEPDADGAVISADWPRVSTYMQIS
jgi:hypothetical protein